jgi:hypothetical protein
VRRYDADKVAGRNYLGLLPEPWEMPLVAGYQVVGVGGIGAFHIINENRQEISSCFESATSSKLNAQNEGLLTCTDSGRI